MSWLPSVRCILQNWTFHIYLVVYSVGTLGFIGVLGIPALASIWLIPNDAVLKSKVRRRFFQSLYLMIYFFYPIASQYILSMLRCISYYEELDHAPYFKERWLLSVDCC